MAALVAVGAVLAVVGALLTVRVADRTRRRVQEASHRMTAGRPDVRRQATLARGRLGRAEADLVRLRERSREMDTSLRTMTDDLRATRSSLGSLTSGPVDGFMRMAGWLSQAARLAMLWR